MQARAGLRILSRPLLAAMFAHGGLDAVRNPETKVPRAKRIVAPIVDRLPGDVTAVDLVRANGAAQVGAALALATGRAPRVAAAVLAASLVPTTLAGHAFWRETEPSARAQQRIHFLKNLAMLGGLLAVVAEPAPART